MDRERFWETYSYFEPVSDGNLFSVEEVGEFLDISGHIVLVQLEPLRGIRLCEFLQRNCNHF